MLNPFYIPHFNFGSYNCTLRRIRCQILKKKIHQKPIGKGFYKKHLELLRIERDKAVTEQLKGDRIRTTAKSEALRLKDMKIIKGQQEVELAEIQAKREIVERNKEASLAIIDKKKELQVATANEGIQQANERAAKFEAQSKLHIGLAEAQIISAKYKAYDKTLYSMEIQRDTMKYVTKNLQGITIKMPQINISGGSDGKPINSVDTVLQTIGVQKLDELAKSLKK